MKQLLTSTALITSIALSGCAMTKPVMTTEAANDIGRMHALGTNCLNSNKIDGKTAAALRDAANYAVSTWSEPKVATISSVYEARKNDYVTELQCSYIYSFISRMNQHKQQVASQSQANTQAWKDLNDQLQRNKPVYCTSNTTGTLTTTNCY
ncbi:hypothetical protein [Agarivorans sp. DSG3-1]|uniref:hypothetical protein n=1 Tax=Agarivorans sp. DSG3-1 TaxID=3342249 RepID=UPI00398EEC48